ncbi:hypothetical protein [Aliarcobacter skirrowii]|uniref:hypothetical protein n=1 Tax=Aliarcobacter skirrowii TaxID=28200 RepID=UPI001401F751|nr:hypothetical protein [Aliarcobacter skirrowii]
MINLQNYTKQELIILKKEIEEIINKKNLEIDEIEFDFEAEEELSQDKINNFVNFNIS